MSVTVASPKTSRLDLRMKAEQKNLIEKAAEMAGMTVSQWSMSALMKCAREDIAEWHTLRLCSADFDALLTALDSPMDEKFEEFASGKTRWEG